MSLHVSPPSSLLLIASSIYPQSAPQLCLSIAAISVLPLLIRLGIRNAFPPFEPSLSVVNFLSKNSGLFPQNITFSPLIIKTSKIFSETIIS